jgi:hypothetical protein
MVGSHAPRPKKNRDTVHNETWLRARYLNDAMSAREIAALVNCSQPTILWALRKFAIPIRTNSESRRGRPNRTVWTPEMREAMAARRRGEANPMYGTVSPWRGRHKPVDHETRHYGRGRARVVHPQQPCEVCGYPKADRHHRNGNATDNSTENIQFLCRVDHLRIGHSGHWGVLNLPSGMSDERPAGPPLTKKSPMSAERAAEVSAIRSANGGRLMTPERAVAMAHKSQEVNPLTPDRAREMSSRRGRSGPKQRALDRVPLAD